MQNVCTFLMEDQRVLVIDAGSHSIRYGWAGDDAPAGVTATASFDALDDEPLIRDGRFASMRRLGDLFDSLVPSLPHWYGSLPEADNRPHALLLAVPYRSTPADYASILTLAFDRLGLEAVFFVNAVFAGHMASGRNTTLSVDCGHSHISIFPVTEGYRLPRAQTSAAIGGHDVGRACTSFLIELLDGRTPSQDEISRFREQCPLVRSIAPNAPAPDGVVFVLDDASEIVVPGHIRSACGEVLFFPPIIQRDVTGLADLIVEAIRACDVDARRIMATNVFRTSALPPALLASHL